MTGGPENRALYAEAATDKAPFTSPPAMLLPLWCLQRKTKLSPQIKSWPYKIMWVLISKEKGGILKKNVKKKRMNCFHSHRSWFGARLWLSWHKTWVLQEVHALVTTPASHPSWKSMWSRAHRDTCNLSANLRENLAKEMWYFCILIWDDRDQRGSCI